MDQLYFYLQKILGYIGTAVFVVFFFGFCIFIHELGHFLVAKWRGLHVVAFSIGFKKVWSFTRGGIEYRIGCIPCGGYVDLPQIDATGEPRTEDGKVLPRAKPIDRVLTAFAGPFFNILFGLALGCVVWHYGLPLDTPKMKEIIVAKITDPKSPEAEAGLHVGDVIFKINGKEFDETWNGVVKKVLFTIGKVTLDVRRGNEKIKISYKPKANKKAMPNEQVGIPFFKPKFPVNINPLDDSPAIKGGVKDGDQVIKVDGVTIDNRTDFLLAINGSKGKPIKLDVLRDNKPLELTVSPTFLKEVYQIGIIYGPQPQTGLLVISAVSPDSAAEKAGLQVKDTITTVNGKRVGPDVNFKGIVEGSGGKPLELTVKRKGKILKLKMAPRITRIYDIGVAFVTINPGRYFPDPFTQFVNVIDMTYKSLRGIIYSFFGQSTLKPRNMSGPIGIVRVISIVVHKGHIIQGIHIITLITFSLALLNLLPLPVLDGGHITFAVIEMFTGRPLPVRLILPLTYVFVFLLISLMIFVSYYDSLKLYRDFAGPEDEEASQEQKAQSPGKNVKAAIPDSDTLPDSKKTEETGLGSATKPDTKRKSGLGNTKELPPVVTAPAPAPAPAPAN